jgi:hypothetical protein
MMSLAHTACQGHAEPAARNSPSQLNSFLTDDSVSSDGTTVRPGNKFFSEKN